MPFGLNLSMSSARFSKPFSFVSFEKKAKLDVDFKQVMGAQFRGSPCLLFYVLRFVNTSGENVTLKEIVLRLKGRQDIDSTVLTTGQVETPKGERTESMMVQLGSPHRANIALIGWKIFGPSWASIKHFRGDLYWLAVRPSSLTA